MLNVEQWAEIRRLHAIEKLSIRALARRFNLHRKTIRRALRSADPPRYSRPARPSKLDPFKDEVRGLLQDEPRMPAVRIRELLQPLGYSGGETILKAYVRDVRPLFLPVRTYQRTLYRPGELAQCDLWEPSAEIPVGCGQTRKAYVVTLTLGYSRAGAGTLIFSKKAPDILFGLWRCLVRIGRLPETLVWDREGALHAGDARPTIAFAAFCGVLRIGWRFLAPADPEAKGVAERSHGYLETNFEPGRHFANPADFQDQLDRWYDEKANLRIHRTLRCRPIDRLVEELQVMRPLPPTLPDLDRRWVLRVPPQPYARVDTNDYSLDPRFAERRVEVRVSQIEVSAIALDTGELVARHLRSFARHRTITALEHARLLRTLRGAPEKAELEVEVRPLARYDRLIPA